MAIGTQEALAVQDFEASKAQLGVGNRLPACRRRQDVSGVAGSALGRPDRGVPPGPAYRGHTCDGAVGGENGWVCRFVTHPPEKAMQGWVRRQWVVEMH
jgi:hypothetical protein